MIPILFRARAPHCYSQSWTLGTLKVTMISIPIFCKKVTTVPITAHFLKSDDYNDARYRFSILFKRKSFLVFFQQSYDLKIVHYLECVAIVNTFDLKAPCI